MTTSVFIRNDSPEDGKHASVFVGVKYPGSDTVYRSTEKPLAPGEGVTTTVYLGMSLVVLESEE